MQPKVHVDKQGSDPGADLEKKGAPPSSPPASPHANTAASITTNAASSSSSLTSSTFLPSPEAIATFQILEESGGLKSDASGTDTIETNMSVLGDPTIVFPKTIGVYVDINLEREKDRSLPDRAKLAIEVKDTVSNELETIFRGCGGGGIHDKFTLRSSAGQGHDDADVVLCVRVLLVSDGSSLGHRWMAEGGVGSAKLTLAYCLVNATTGQVAAANQLYATEDCSPGSKDANFREYAAAVVRTMARNLAGDIAEEVTNSIISWKQEKKGRS